MKKKTMIAAVIATALVAAGISGAEGTGTVGQASVFPVPQHGKLAMHIPAGWKHGLRQPPGNIPPTITLVPASGDEFKTLITVLWSPKQDAGFNKPDALKRLIADDLRDMLPGAVEKDVSVQDFKGQDASGYYFLVTDKAPKPGEYPYAVRAVTGVGDLLLSVTVLCRAKDSVGITETIKALETATQERQ